MYVTSSEQRGGLFVAVISGGRPLLKQRPTAGFLAAIEAIGVHSIAWVVSERDAVAYEPDRYPLCTYPREWAYEYAAAHWMSTEHPEPGGFLGAFPGREWACMEAERRGCWGVLQLDDNLKLLYIATGNLGGIRVAERNGGLGLYTDMLAGVALSTNSRMTGATLGSVSHMELNVARAGFPYSVFIERVGDSREPWYGPFEDDITHAFQYGTRHDGATAALLPSLRYQKENKSKTGMRSKYTHTRAVQLQRLFPQSAKIGVRSKSSNGRGNARVFHTMLPGAIRNPLRVRDKQLFGAVKDRTVSLLEEWHTEYLIGNREKVARRAASSARRTA